MGGLNGLAPFGRCARDFSGCRADLEIRKTGSLPAPMPPLVILPSTNGWSGGRRAGTPGIKAAERIDCECQTATGAALLWFHYPSQRADLSH